MSGKSMDVFSLRDSVVGEYRKFATSFTTIHAEDIRAQVEAIYAEGRFWPDPLIQINPSYKRGANFETLIADGALDPRTADIFRDRRRAALPVQAPGAGHRARGAGRELRRHDGHGLRQVALLLHPHRECGARGETQGAPAVAPGPSSSTR